MKTTIISLGGSLIVPKEVDSVFLSEFKKTILKCAHSNHQFIIFCGGGRLARDYQEALKEIADAPQEALDWIGIHATRINAELVKEMFGTHAYDVVVIDPTKKISSQKKIIIAAGWKPGWSTDYDAVLVAKQMKCDCLINMSNVEYVYNADPRKVKTAKPLKEMSWKQLRSLVGNTWTPGLSMPFDPIAAKGAEKLKLKVTIIGKDIPNLENLLSKKPFKGTVIK